MVAPLNMPVMSDIDLSNWDVSHADSMYRAFSNANVFNQYIGNWDVSKVTNMEWMFIDANSFNQDNISHLANIPFTNVLVKGVCFRKHIRHISHFANIPTANILVKDKIRTLGDRIDIGKYSDIDTVERVEIIRDLRLGVFDVLVGINLLINNRFNHAFRRNIIGFIVGLLFFASSCGFVHCP
jgi:hypothetical protein